MDLRRLILTFDKDGIQLRTLYRTSTGANPQTKARRREVEQLARTGLERALAALDGGRVDMVGESGFEVREDALAIEEGAA